MEDRDQTPKSMSYQNFSVPLPIRMYHESPSDLEEGEIRSLLSYQQEESREPLSVDEPDPLTDEQWLLAFMSITLVFAAILLTINVLPILFHG